MRSAFIAKYRDVLQCSLDFNDGWLLLVGDMLDEMVQRIELVGYARSTLQVRQIKEKYGTLRCYYRAPICLEDVVNRAESRSALTCEWCGRIGRVQGRGRIACICEHCARALQFSMTELNIANVPEGLRVTFETCGNDEVRVTVCDPCDASMPSFTVVHKNDAGLAVAELVNGLLEDGSDGPRNVSMVVADDSISIKKAK